MKQMSELTGVLTVLDTDAKLERSIIYNEEGKYYITSIVDVDSLDAENLIEVDESLLPYLVSLKTVDEPNKTFKICKECGDPFVPEKAQHKYCNKEHFRPCPVCGKLVFAKYLSDPARCCNGICRAILGKRNKSESETNTGVAEEVVAPVEEAIVEKHVVNDENVRRYIGEDDEILNTGSDYEVEISSPEKGKHLVHVIYNVTDDKIEDTTLTFTNKKLIPKTFKAIKK